MPGEGRRRLASEMNVVPYIDVMLVLLVIFMVTAPLLQPGVEVDLPEAQAESLDYGKDKEILEVSVTQDGGLYLSHGPKTDVPLTDEEVLRIAGILLEREPDRPVVVRGDTNVPYGRIMHAMSLLKQAGAKKVGLPTQPEVSP